jgi:ferritin-like metal-binding protein YciE
MATITSLRTHLIDELTDLLDAESQLTEALPKLAQAATSKPLRAAFQKHLKETRGHITRLNQALRSLGETPSSKTCEGMQGLLKEGKSMMKKTSAGSLRDAMMITGAQKVEHYEMASYGTARTYARVLGEKAIARLLEQTLKEERNADKTLTRIAEEAVNEDAAEAWQAQDDESLLNRAAKWAGSTAGYASGQMATRLRAAASTMGIPQRRSSKGPRSESRPGHAGRRGQRAVGKKR